jgi:hypothetical protein
MYYKIIVSDNGIAFTRIFRKIFLLFKLETNPKYSGTGLD